MRKQLNLKECTPAPETMDADELEDYLELQDADLQEEIRQSYQEYLEGKARPLDEFIAELLAESEKPKKRTTK